MSAAAPGRGPAPRGVALLILMAVGFGILAALLSAGVQSTFTPGRAPQPLLIHWWTNPVNVLGLAGFLVFVGYVGYQVYVRIRDGRMPVPARLAAFAIAGILVAVVFVALFDLVHAALAPSTPGPAMNQTVPGSGGGAPTGGNSTNGTPVIPFPGIPLFTWADFALVALVVATVCALLWAYYFRAGPASPADAEATAARLRNELIESLRRLDADPNADPREIILALYQRLLLLLRPRFNSTDPYTAREITQVLVTQFGVRAEHAADLTELFEVARYSTHPLGRPEADRARAAFRAIADDLRPVGLEEGRPYVPGSLESPRPSELPPRDPPVPPA